MVKPGGSGGPKPMHSTPAKPMRSNPVKSGPSSGGMKPSRPSSPQPVSKPVQSGGYKDHDSSPSPSKSKFLTPKNLMKMRKMPKDGGPKIRPDGTFEEYVQEETDQQSSGGSRGCGCLPGCAFGVLTTLATLATLLVKLL